jgi:Flp pilus assembly pilin Flp
MKEDYEGQGLERFWHTLLTLAIIGAVSALGLSVYAIWRALT